MPRAANCATSRRWSPSPVTSYSAIGNPLPGTWPSFGQFHPPTQIEGQPPRAGRSSRSDHTASAPTDARLGSALTCRRNGADDRHRDRDHRQLSRSKPILQYVVGVDFRTPGWATFGAAGWGLGRSGRVGEDVEQAVENFRV